MMRNLESHKAEETKEGYNWSAWQAEQLKALRQYRQRNKDKYTKEFSLINAQIDGLIKDARKDGQLEQEKKILQAIKSGRLEDKMDSTFEGKFFKTNDRKINSLIKATKKDFKRGETAMLRQADDQYRKIIFNAQMYAASGAGTYEKAVDMATKDFLTRGITSIEYKNGSRHTMEDYSRMCLRTACKRAYFTGEGEMRNSRGQHLVIMIKRGNPCPKCAPWVGKVLIDDVWSGGSREDGDYPLMSEAIAAGLYHPNCLDSHTTYFDDGFDEEYDREHDSDTNVGNMKEEYTKEERQQLAEEYNIEQKAGYAKRQQERFERLEEFSLDPENKRMYGARAQEWERLKKERFKHVNMKTGGEETNIYAENIRFSSNVQKRLDKEFGHENSKEKIKRLYEEADVWKDKLKRDERRYITKYAFNPGGKGEEKLFYRINAMLRGEIKNDEKIQRYADSISNGIKKFDLKDDIICYRRTDNDYSKNCEVGNVFRFHQFLSTSIVSKGTLTGDIFYIIYVHKGTKGALIESLSYYKKQKEFLIDKDVLFRVISRKDNVVTLEVINGG